MTKLLMNKFNGNEDYTQKIRVYNTLSVKVIRLHAYKQGTLPTSNLYLRVYDTSTAELIGSCAITHTQINTISGNFWHGFISFEFENSLHLSVLPETDYREFSLVFRLEDYIDSEDNYFGFCRDYEKYIRNTLEGFSNAPLYGDYTVDGITTYFSDNAPIGLEFYKTE